MDTCGFVLVRSLEILEGLGCADISHTASRDNSFLNGSTGCTECILHAVLLLFHLNLGGCADIEYCHTAGQFAETLLKFLPVIVGSGGLDLLADKVCPFCDGLLVSESVNDGGVLFGNDNLLCVSEHIRSAVLEGEAPFL